MERPVKSYRLHEFVDSLTELYEDANKEDDFILFALNGVHSGTNTQAAINLMPDAMQLDERFIRKDDFDSVIGIDRNIKFSKDLEVSCLPKKQDTLTISVHLNVQTQTPNGREVVALHRIPNVCLGTAGNRSLIRYFIPQLYKKERKSSQLTQEELVQFYEKGLRPAVEALDFLGVREWPTNYNNEMWRARSRAGTLSFKTVMFSGERARLLSQELRIAFMRSDLPWATGAFIMHQIRGVKGAHSFERDKGREALNHLLDTVGMTPDDISSGHWWVDCGLQIASPDTKCLIWRSDAHWRLAKAALNISEQRAKELTTPGSTKYSRDPCSGLTQASGFRAAPGATTRGPLDALYVQAYTTDKSITARREGRRYAKHLHGEDYLQGKAIDYLEQIYTVYSDATIKNISVARIEIRLPYKHALKAFQNLTDDILYNSLFSVPSPAYWALRAYRSEACRLILERQQMAPHNLRISNSALILSAACIWLVNALHATPDMGRSCRELIDLAIPRIDRHGANRDVLAFRAPLQELDMDVDTDAGERVDGEGLMLSNLEEDNDGPRRTAPESPDTAAAYPHGIVFLLPIRLTEDHPCPRFTATIGHLSPEAFEYHFRTSLAELIARCTAAPPLAHRDRNTVSRRRQQRFEAVVPLPNLHLEALRSIQLPPLAIDTGDDHDGELVPVAMDPFGERNLETRVLLIFRKFIIDIAMTCPNGKSNRSSGYCRLPVVERNQVDDSTFRNTDLSNFFYCCQWKIAQAKEWKMSFDNAFPHPSNPKAGKTVMHYPTTAYYPDYLAMLMRLETRPDIIETVRRQLKTLFDTLTWAPLFCADRMWATKLRDGTKFRTFRYEDCPEDLGNGPQVLFKPDSSGHLISR